MPTPRPDPHDIGREQARGRFVERMGEELAGAGMQRMAARAFAALIASDGGTLTAAELADELRASPAAVSGAMRYLEQVDLVRRRRPAGSRRDQFRVSNQVWYESLLTRGNLIDRWQSVMREGAADLGRDTDAGARLDLMAEYFAFMREELQAMMERWRERVAELDPDTGS